MHFEVDKAIEKLKRDKSPGTDQIPADLIKIGCKNFALISTILLILYGIRRNCPKSGRSRSLYLFIRAIKQTELIIEAYHFVNYVQKFIQPPVVKVNSIC